MARQKGIIKLEGTIGDISFYKSRDGHLARTKGGVSGERIQNDPAFQRTRENGQEFGKAGAAGRLLRTSFRQYIKKSADSRMVSRLTREMVKVIKSDTTNGRGQRNVLEGDLTLLKGFEFNIGGKLATTFYTSYEASVDRAIGELRVNVPSFTPAFAIASPEGATHMRLISAGSAVNFGEDDYQAAVSQSDEIELNQTATPLIELVNQLPANVTGPLFLLLGIEFFQNINGTSYPLKNGKFNALALIEVITE
ncbi:MAG: hypothetical protein V5A47_11260 [Bacteroidales bacterium]|nr:hypothetical protein [Candidatus Cloacimonadota bacterium]MBS3772351.1 hypothetical protein [Bacteroidales bacterium]